MRCNNCGENNSNNILTGNNLEVIYSSDLNEDHYKIVVCYCCEFKNLYKNNQLIDCHNNKNKLLNKYML